VRISLPYLCRQAAGIGEGAGGDQHPFRPQGAAAGGVDLNAVRRVARTEIASSAMITAPCCRATSVSARTMARGLT
jgi:hypothetical protein